LGLRIGIEDWDWVFGLRIVDLGLRFEVWGLRFENWGLGFKNWRLCRMRIVDGILNIEVLWIKDSAFRIEGRVLMVNDIIWRIQETVLTTED
jgi:hypothetical protein